jgi:hypothetical protein
MGAEPPQMAEQQPARRAEQPAIVDLFEMRCEGGGP